MREERADQAPSTIFPSSRVGCSTLSPSTIGLLHRAGSEIGTGSSTERGKMLVRFCRPRVVDRDGLPIGTDFRSASEVSSARNASNGYDCSFVSFVAVCLGSFDRSRDLLKQKPLDSKPKEIRRFAGTVPNATTTGDIESMVMYAGAAVELIKEILPAAEVVKRLVVEAQQLISNISSVIE
ncbi:hypothetical protein KFK09_024891 [Dendrobium nobile]|uniref:Uncharacterized protein n=1 Tax=Dendrobium nobile TaxID=94219 RepID=A0A8T3AF17_DENNO|nr:hypothetical protein KFK09_024891 [Dendrobium nobile]